MPEQPSQPLPDLSGLSGGSVGTSGLTPMARTDLGHAGSLVIELGCHRGAPSQMERPDADSCFLGCLCAQPEAFDLGPGLPHKSLKVSEQPQYLPGFPWEGRRERGQELMLSVF